MKKEGHPDYHFIKVALNDGTFFIPEQVGLEHLHGQFALACWDENRRRLVIGRDRFGICPMFWTRQTSNGGDWLLFGSETRGIPVRQISASGSAA